MERILFRMLESVVVTVRRPSVFLVDMREAEAEGLRVSDTYKAVVSERMVSTAQLKVKVEFVLSAVHEVRRKGEKAVVRKESADTQEYESCQQKDVKELSQWVDMEFERKPRRAEFSFPVQ